MKPITRQIPRRGLWLRCTKWHGPCLEHQMSDDTKLGFLLLFVVFAIMVIGPVLAG